MRLLGLFLASAFFVNTAAQGQQAPFMTTVETNESCTLLIHVGCDDLTLAANDLGQVLTKEVNTGFRSYSLSLPHSKEDCGRPPDFNTKLGSIMAVKWGTDRRGEESLFCLGKYTRKNGVMTFSPFDSNKDQASHFIEKGLRLQGGYLCSPFDNAGIIEAINGRKFGRPLIQCEISRDKK